MINALEAEKRNSIKAKTSVSEATSKLSLTGRLSHQMTPPRKKDRLVSSRAGQLFLCVIGAILNLGVFIWLALFSAAENKNGMGRALVAICAAICAATFGLLAIATIRRKSVKSSPIDMISNTELLRQRRSLTNSSFRKNTRTGDEILSPGPRRQSSLMNGVCEEPKSQNSLYVMPHFQRGTST